MRIAAGALLPASLDFSAGDQLASMLSLIHFEKDDTRV
jgi:hypothetical protein